MTCAETRRGERSLGRSLGKPCRPQIFRVSDSLPRSCDRASYFRGYLAPRGSEDEEDEEAIATATLPTWPQPPRGAQKTKKTQKLMVPALADLPVWRRELVNSLGELCVYVTCV